MIQLRLQYSGWYNDTQVFVKGYCFDSKNNFLQREALLNYFSKVNTQKELEEKLKEANGIFSLVIVRPEFNAIALDRTRIYPLFYKKKEKDYIIISDNAYELVEKGKDTFNQESVDEYLHSSIVMGNKTLINGIFQVCPSSYVLLNKDGDPTSFYYSDFRLTEKEEIAAKDAEKEVKEAIQHSIQRLILSAEGRQLVVPLSGGYDSRLIVSLLKKSGYKNVVCYNVGRPENPEHKLSKKVTDTLGFPYYFIDNSAEAIIGNYENTGDFNKYYEYSGNLSNSFWMYEYFGIKYLKEHHLIEDNAIFLPGHSGDFLGGSQFTKAGIKKFEIKTEIIRKLCQYKFVLGDHSINNNIKKNLQYFTEEKRDDVFPYSIFEDFDYKEKLPKYINNSARIYAFFGFKVRLFFWDNELMDVFRRLPYQLRINKKFYDEIVEKEYFTPYHILFKEELKTSVFKIKWQQIKNKIKSNFIPGFISKRINRAPDHTCMKEISTPLSNELEANNIHIFGSYNKIFLHWYLLKIGYYNRKMSFHDKKLDLSNGKTNFLIGN